MAGDSVAGEAQAGTLRYILVRPVGRTRLLVAKLVSIIAFVLLTVVVVAVTAYLVGALLLGNQPLAATSVSGSALTTQELFIRTLGAIAYVTLSMLGVAAIALLLTMFLPWYEKSYFGPKGKLQDTISAFGAAPSQASGIASPKRNSSSRW